MKVPSFFDEVLTKVSAKPLYLGAKSLISGLVCAGSEDEDEMAEDFWQEHES